MNYAIQTGLYQDRHEQALLETLNRFGLPVFNFKYIPFEKTLKFEDEEPVGKTMCFGSVSLTRLSKDYGWTPGIFHNENHDYQVYSKHWGDHLLNSDSKIQKLIDPVELDFFFARPTGDGKLFKGELYGRSMWEFTRDHGISNGADPNTLIQICTPKEIQQEARFFIIKGEIVTASFYKFGAKVIYRRCDDEDLHEFVRERISEFQLADAFVIDVCRTEKGIRIVECNCLNCSGFYDIDMPKLITAIEENF